jgi:hypothetical protein
MEASTDKHPSNDPRVGRGTTNPKYFTYHERWLKKPGVHGDFTHTNESVSHIANPNWGIVGAGAAVSGDVTYNAAGMGIQLETQATADDQVWIEPHTTAGASMIDDVQWNTAKQPYLYIDIVTGDATTNRLYTAGFVTATSSTKTSTDLTMALNDEAFQIAYSTEHLTSLTNWCAVSSRLSTETETDSGVAVVASTRYRIEMWLDADRKPQYYIDGAQVCTADNTAITAVTDIFPMFGVMSHSTNEADFVCYSVMVSQLYG